MNEELQQIGLRLKGLRDSLDMNKEEFSSLCHISVQEYTQYEAGEKDFPLSLLKLIATNFNVDINTLIFDDEPRMNSYALTRKEKGLVIDRAEGYQYQALASGFTGRKTDIFIVTVHPRDFMPLRTHTGQEFCLVIEGKLKIEINDKEFILEQGDSLYFDPNLPHGMNALDNKPAKFLTVIV